MPRRIIAEETDNEPILIGQSEDVTQVSDDQKRMEDEILAEIGMPDNAASYFAKVYRVPAKGKSLADLFDTTAEEIPGIIARVREEYGDGNYLIRVYKNNQLWKASRFSVELPRSSRQQVPTADQNAMRDLVMQLGQTQQALLAQVASLKAAPPAPAMDMVGMMNAFAQMMIAMKTMAPPPVDPTTFLLKGIELASGLSSEGREKGALDLISDFLKSPLLEQVTQAQPPRQLQARPIPAGGQNVRVPPQSGAQVQTPPQTAPSAPPPVNADPQMQQFQQYLAFLVDKAKANADQELYTDLILDNVPADQIKMFLTQPDPVGVLARVNPAVGEHRAWFVILVNDLTSALDAAQTEAHANRRGPASERDIDDPGRGGGHSSDAANYEPISPHGEEIADDTD